MAVAAVGNLARIRCDMTTAANALPCLEPHPRDIDLTLLSKKSVDIMFAQYQQCLPRTWESWTFYCSSVPPQPLNITNDAAICTTCTPHSLPFFTNFYHHKRAVLTLSRGRGSQTIYSCIIWPSGRSGPKLGPPNRPVPAVVYSAVTQGQGRLDTWLMFMRRTNHYCAM